MDVSVTNFQGKVITIKAEPTTTVAELKKLILAAEPTDTTLYLAVNGKVLKEDDQTIIDAGIKGANDTVHMLRRMRN
jgi:hypothetical protein